MALKRIYHPDAADPAIVPQSWWEASADPMRHTTRPVSGSGDYDVAIIGGGYTGLNAALHLARAGQNVCVAEAGHIGWGASGRNGGFCGSFSSKMSLREIATKYGKDGALHVIDVQSQAVEQVRGFITDAGQPSHTPMKNAELAVAHSPYQLAQMQSERADFRDILGLDVPIMGKEELNELGAGSAAFYGGMIEPWGFGLHPLNYVRALADAAIDAGATVSTQTEVQDVARTNGLYVLKTPHGEIRAPKLIIATNGYTAETIPKWSAGRLLPAVSSILVTRPITPHEQAAQGWTTHHMTYDTRTLLHYFRLLPDGRMMFGGRGASSGDPVEQQAFYAELRRQFEEIFPHWSQIETAYQWSGFVCINRKRAQYLGPIDADNSAFASVAYHGSGVAMASWSGKTLADLILGNCTLTDLPRLYTDKSPKFPFAFLRPLYLRAAYVRYRQSDKK